MRAAWPQAPTTRLPKIQLRCRLPVNCAIRANRAFHSTPHAHESIAPLRQELKNKNKAARQQDRATGTRIDDAKLDVIPGWELTVGIEIHAQLNTARKLFSGQTTRPQIVPRII